MEAFTPAGAHTSITSGRTANKRKSSPMISCQIKRLSTDFCLTGIPIYTKFAELPDTQKLIAASGHIDVIGFALRTFLIQKLEHGVFVRCALQQYCHENK